MSTKIIISIIIPAFNEVNTITHLLDSLRDQNFDLQTVEIIIVDNGSTDGTINAVRNYANKHRDATIILASEQKHHVSAARNTGAKIAKGEILLFLDADNICDRSLLKDIYKKAILEGYEAGTICTLANEESTKGHIIFLILELIKIILSKPFGKNFCTKQLFETIHGYNETISIGTNIDFLCRIKKLLDNENKRMCHIQKPIFTSLRRFEKVGYIIILFKWLCGYVGIRNISY